MSGSLAPGAAAVEARLGAAAAQLLRARQALGRGAMPDLIALADHLERLDGDVSGLAPADRRRLRPTLLALLDEVTALGARLEAERQRMQARLRSAGTRRRADAAYRRNPR